MAENEARKTTIEDVARAAGVSRAAVTKVLRNAYGVSPAMKLRVDKAIEELYYRPSVAARAMRGSSYTLGIEIPDFGNQFFTRVLRGASRALAGTNYQLIIAPAEEGMRQGYRAIEALLDQRVDGLIAVSPLVSQEWLERAAVQTPIVMFGRHDESPYYDTVAGDDSAGTAALMQHLFDLGHQRIAHLTINALSSAARSPHDIRLTTYEKCMVDAGLAGNIRVIRCGEGLDPSYEAARDMLDEGPAPTAIVAGHDELALGALRAVMERGLPISVAGYDDVPLAGHPLVSLTSVSQPGEDMGARAVEMLLERLAGRDVAEHETYAPELRPRKTTYPPARES
jgi:LacI family transcriptional regulator